jgi:exodeoxyribonuclease-3
LRIVTWNVNGFRSVLGKGAGEWIHSEAPDVVCLQEIKMMPGQIPEAYQAQLQEFDQVWHPAQRPGYSGVLTLMRKPPLEVRVGLGVSRFDDEGRLIRTRHPGFLLYNIYFPNGKRDHTRLQYKLDFYAYLLDECDREHARGENIILTGDFNTAHNEIDLKHPKANATTSGFLPEEREWISRYLDHGFADPFRQMYPDRVQYTWWTYITNARQKNVGWRIDFFLVSQGLMSCVKDVITHQQVMGSDHCPVELVVEP